MGRNGMADLEVRDAPSGASDDAEERDLIEDELLVEEISIDGMCGVY
jgi:mycofactocin precursor